MACSLASRSSRFAAALRADLDAISARHPKDPAVGTKSWLKSNKKLNVYLDTPNPHVSNPGCHRGKIPDCFAALATTRWGQRAPIRHRHPEAAASSAALEGRRPRCIPALHPSRLAARRSRTAWLAPQDDGRGSGLTLPF